MTDRAVAWDVGAADHIRIRGYLSSGARTVVIAGEGDAHLGRDHRGKAALSRANDGNLSATQPTPDAELLAHARDGDRPGLLQTNRCSVRGELAGPPVGVQISAYLAAASEYAPKASTPAAISTSSQGPMGVCAKDFSVPSRPFALLGSKVSAA